ncbi:MAG: MATE family efflux transporter, partial [Oscillospiraceae bacterium]|nr:MATE family efflux transporter [Oscillospiraceae bacterium]
MKKNAVLMTEGGIAGHLIAFSLPLMVGYIFQQLYNTVDSIVVGRFVSMQALAAVGSTGNAIYTLIGAFMGLASGAGVVISQHYGAREEQRVHEAVHTAVVLSLIFGVFFTLAGYFFA